MLLGKLKLYCYSFNPNIYKKLKLHKLVLNYINQLKNCFEIVADFELYFMVLFCWLEFILALNLKLIDKWRKSSIFIPFLF